MPLLGAYPQFGRSILGLSPSDLPFMNFLKESSGLASSTVGFQGGLTADGYPNSTPVTDISGGCFLPSNYYGRYRLSFSGRGSLSVGSQSFIVYSGSAFIQTGDLGFRLAILDQTNPSVEFAFGFTVTGASSGTGGVIRLAVSPAMLNPPADGSLYMVQGVNGTTEANGLWPVKAVSGALELQGSTFVHAYVSGGEAIAQAPSMGVTFNAVGTYSGMTNAVLCRKADIDGTNAFGLQAGYQCNADLISRLQSLRPYAVRFLNLNGVINSLASDYSKRPQTTAFTYNNDLVQSVPSYWVIGGIARGASDAYTCVNPSGSGAGAYADGETVQGVVDLTNLTTTPTLQLGTRGAKPVFMDNAASVGVVGGTIAAGHTINTTFTGSYIAGSPYTLPYTTVSGDNGTTSGGVLVLAGHLAAAINADATLAAANISADAFGKNLSLIYNRNAGSGTTFAATSTGAETISFGTCPVDGGVFGIPGNAVCTFVYNAILGGWLCTVGALRSGFAVPTEVVCELCNRANVNPWFNIPLLYPQSSVAALAANVAANLNSNLSVFAELSNEIWNFNQTCTSTARNLGASLGLSFQGGVGQYESFYGLRVRQSMAQFATAWVANGRSRSTLKCILAHSFGAETTSLGGATQVYRLNGTDLTTANATYNAFVGVSYTATGQRPIDVCDGISYAPYYAGSLLVNFANGSGWTGSVATYAALLQAGKDYATGGQANTDSALTALDADARINVAGTLALSKLWETMYATYDTPRNGLGLNKLEVYCYEGGYEGTTGNNFSDSASATPLTDQFTNNVWNTTPYGASNAVVAQQVVNVFFAYKNSRQFLLTNKLLLENVQTAHLGRIAYPAWFQFTGPSIWAMYPGDIYTTPYKSFNAFGLFNS